MLGLHPWTQIQETLELCCAELQNGREGLQRQNHRATVSHMSCLSRIIIAAGKRCCLLSEDWLGSETIAQSQGATLRPQGCSCSCCPEYGWECFWSGEKFESVGGAGMCLRADPWCLPDSIFVPWNWDRSTIISTCHQF